MKHLIDSLSTTEKTFISLFLVLKLAVLIWFPLTGDEAYFISWGDDVSLGYYDHPPVAGWAIYALSFISDNYYLYRFFAFLVSLAVSATLYQFVVAYRSRVVAFYISLVFFVSPLSLFLTILTNDVVLVLFGFVGFYFFSSALKKKSMTMAIAAGVFLGLAFLSKYLSVIMLSALLLYVLMNLKKDNYRLILIMLAIVLFCVAENIYFNLNNCWNNIVFNLVARTEGSSFEPDYIALFFLSLFFLVPPQGIYLLTKANFKDSPDFIRQALYVTIIFVVIFFIVSTFKKIGLHWLALYIPFVYLLFADIQKEKLPFLLIYNAVISILVSLFLLMLSTQYNWLFEDHKNYRDLLFYTETSKICDMLPEGEMILTLGYTKNSILSQHCKNNEFHVMFSMSKYGREDDKKMSFSQYDQKSLYIFTSSEKKVAAIRPYFNAVHISPVSLRENVSYYLIEAEGFNFEKYKTDILSNISKNYYTPPSWLPASECEFNNKYAL
ncbi:MAG TPA: glycosyltransferase family 39 protein [Gammaproteobacteria bacterium]|nr:glycosyltransferase family 39 protein [Gammaproteobacteria bacterium]